MKDKVTRRDFLNGTRVAIGASLLSPWAEVFGSTDKNFTLPPDYYPPAATGLRGSHNGSWETMHARVHGASWPIATPDETVDLVVVGGGISGLSAAHFFRNEKPDARILVLDNHDDFGGHAKRNEFSVGGDTRIAYGGTEAIDTPSAYAEVSRQLLVDVGIEPFHERQILVGDAVEDVVGDQRGTLREDGGISTHQLLHRLDRRKRPVVVGDQVALTDG